jgi:hypothetical protein
MAKTLQQIEVGVRRYAGDDAIVLSTDPGLHILNSVYRDIASQMPWGEFNQTLALRPFGTGSDAITIDGQENYEWSFNSVAVVRFLDVKAVEVETASASDKYTLLSPPETELDWNLASQQSAGLPRMYRRSNQSVSGSAKGDVLLMRPAPSSVEAGGDIKVSGIIEPTDLSSTSDTTKFLVKSADDALEKILAAVFQQRKGETAGSQSNIQNATTILQKILSEEAVTKELINSIVGGQV